MTMMMQWIAETCHAWELVLTDQIKTPRDGVLFVDVGQSTAAVRTLLHLTSPQRLMPSAFHRRLCLSSRLTLHWTWLPPFILWAFFFFLLQHKFNCKEHVQHTVHFYLDGSWIAGQFFIEGLVRSWIVLVLPSPPRPTTVLDRKHSLCF